MIFNDVDDWTSNGYVDQSEKLCASSFTLMSTEKKKFQIFIIVIIVSNIIS